MLEMRPVTGGEMCSWPTVFIRSGTTPEEITLAHLTVTWASSSSGSREVNWGFDALA